MDKEHFRRAVNKQLKKSKLIFNTLEWITGHEDISVQNSIHATDPKKSEQQIAREKKLIKDYWHCGTFHYWRYGLPYIQLNEEALLDYVPTYYHHKKLEKDHSGIDTIYYGDKLNQALLFKERRIPSGEVLAYSKGKKWFRFSDNIDIDIVTYIEGLLLAGNDKLFLKPTNGQGGFGIYVIRYEDDCFIVNGQKKSIAEIVRILPRSSFILQKGILQSQQMMSLNPRSVNTLRVVVQKEGELMKMKSCIIRMGRKGREVDNSAQGGISVKVDIDTGRVSGRATAEHGGEVLLCHPDTEKPFRDITIENWHGLKKQIEEIGTKLIEFKNIALDIAITDKGAVLLEFNFRYGIEHQQCVLGGVRRILSIFPD